MTDAIILAAGKGTRMKSELPKVLVKLGNKPMLEYLLDEITRIEQIKPIIVVGFKYDLVQSQIGSKYDYAFQEGQLGTGHAVLAAQKYSNSENVLVLNGDMPFIKSESIKRLVQAHEAGKNTLSMFSTKLSDFNDERSSFLGFGRIIRDEQGNILKIVEYADATEDQRKITEVNPGIYIFNANWLWRNLPQVQNANRQGEYYLTDMVEMARTQDLVLNSVEIDYREVFGINTEKELAIAERFLAAQRGNTNEGKSATDSA